MTTPDVITVEAGPGRCTYAFGGGTPVVTVRPGSIVTLTTEDCFGGRVRGPADLPSRVCELPYLNPVTGPIAVAGAEPGDTLAVHFVEISPARDWGVSSTFPHFGALTTTPSTAMLHPPLEERVWVYALDTTAGSCRFEATSGDFTVDLPLDPMHGTVGVAPAAGERLMSITPGNHGGNMDTPEMRAGTTAYFGVNVEGAMLAVGDGHARQGEGEVCGTAVETAMRTVLAVDLIKGGAPAVPRLENDDRLFSTGSARPLEDAFRISQHDLVRWTGGLLGLDELDAYQLVSQTGRAPAANVCDTNYTMLAGLPKHILGGARAYDGMHDRLRAVAADHLRHR